MGGRPALARCLLVMIQQAARQLFLLLSDGDGAVFLVGLDEQRHGLDQGQVGECLREVAEVLPVVVSISSA